jgi:hypothetical protein
MAIVTKSVLVRFSASSFRLREVSFRNELSYPSRGVSRVDPDP